MSCGTPTQPLPGPLAPAVRRLQSQSELEPEHTTALLPAASRDMLSSELVEKLKARLRKRRDRQAQLSDCVFTTLVLSQFAVRGGV
ncbi:unnamed protein product, partial [Symbiodinium pilosum]